ncbi:DUF2854 domain-containing protein [cf. Phormidesmis sp. LEGE 11477]|uniref:DUF2854 domain-containing protein n=1 Tax=cf. Phormidesmis sp. LEGE 11477 TaxID=1828680 RepID=UPI00187F6221|nr:DUF2854 domain-containing protein [cf. Phormidesmis sp. LEGE 11477]MBE9061638.1 DUF2854 domain-containing protein [cf. Phormidesmis sp. LEGE 11477]
MRKIPLGTVLLVVGAVLTLVGFVAYAQENATLNLVGFFYGVPILLGGLALRAAELEPVPYTQPTSEAVLALRGQQATQTQTQVRKDVTRYRYGQEAHLDETLERLGLSPNDTQRPVLSGLHEEQRDGAYTLVLEFDSPFVSFEKWQEKQSKIENFFGPGITAEISRSDEEKVAVAMKAVVA